MAVEDFDFGIGADVGGAWLGLEADGLAEQGRELAGRSPDGDDGGGFADTNNAARLAVKLDDVAGLESENAVRAARAIFWGNGFNR